MFLNILTNHNRTGILKPRIYLAYLLENFIIKNHLLIIIESFKKIYLLEFSLIPLIFKKFLI